MKKILTIAEIELIRLNADDILTSSPGLNNSIVDNDDPNNYLAPDRGFFGGSDLNYRGVEKGYEEEEW